MLHGLAVAALLLGGCASTSQLAAPIAQFRSAAEKSLPVARDSMVALNRSERHHRFDEALLDSRIRIDEAITADTFSQAGIRARLDAIAVVDSYTRRLQELVSLDSAVLMKKDEKGLDESLSSLGKTIDSIGGDPSLADYSKPVSALTAAVGTMWTERCKAAVLHEAVTTAGPTVDEILDLLARDVRRGYEDRLEALSLEYDQRRLRYNRNREKWTTARRERALKDLETRYDAIEDLRASSPGDTFLQMRRANDALMAAVEHPRDAASFTTFVNAVQSFSAKVDEAASIYKSFQLAGQAG